MTTPDILFMTLDQQSLSRYRSIFTLQTIREDDIDYKALDYHLPFLERLDTIENSSVALYDFYKQKYQFITNKFKFLLGYNRNDALSDGPQYFFESMHPEDIPRVIDTTYQTMCFLNNLAASEKKDYKLCFTFRMKCASGDYLHLIQQVVVLELSRTGSIWLALVINDIVTPAIDEVFRRYLMNTRNNKYYLFSNDVAQRDSNITLSPRETEILLLMSQGVPSKNIADQLYISVNTVNNHRSNILRKLDAGNTTKAIQYAMKLGIL